MDQSTYPQALTIAGSDSGGGAGIQADLKTFQERGVFGMSVITAITAQNTLGVTAIHTVPTDIIRAQLDAIAADFTPAAYKIGMLGTVATIETIAAGLDVHDFGQLVLDPVMIAKGGAPLLEKDAIDALKTLLLPHADLLTPNLPEAAALTGIEIHSEDDARRAADKLHECGVKTVIIKGGHGAGDESRDWIFTPEKHYSLSVARYATPHTHGTGCTFSTCITAELAKGESAESAIRTAKAYISAAISHPLGIGHGHGPTNHWAYREQVTYSAAANIKS